MSKWKRKWNPVLGESDQNDVEDTLATDPDPVEQSSSQPLEDPDPAEQSNSQPLEDPDPAEQFISWPLAEDTPAKGENPVASIEAPAPTAKELARLNRFPPA